MDCIQARLLIVLQSRDAQELDADARAGLDQHLEVCAACLAWTHQEGRVDEALGQAIQAVPVPAALPSKILHTLEQQRPRRRSPWIAAAAAVLLMATGASGYFWFTQRPELHFADLRDDAGYVAIRDDAATVQEWFAEQGAPILVPARFNYDLLNKRDFATIKGRRVPFLEFFHQGNADSAAAIAHVYVVSEERFDVHELIDSVPSPTPLNNHVVEVRRFGEHAGFVYIIVYTGGSLERAFFVPNGV